MKSSKFSESQIIKALKEDEQGRSVGDLSRELGIDKITLENKTTNVSNYIQINNLKLSKEDFNNLPVQDILEIENIISKTISK